MSVTTDNFELELTQIIKRFSKKSLVNILPSWIQDLGINSSDYILTAERIGNAGYKTDIIVFFNSGKKLKISAKMSSADYFGNWYSHTKLINEFGSKSFNKLTLDCTKWANDWINHANASLFVGVSICFGKRTGNTSKDFLDVFSSTDIIKIVAGTGTGDETANCLYSTSKLPNSIDELFNVLQPIDTDTIDKLSRNFKIAYRPINPMKEGTNRGKCVYTQFVPFKALSEPLIVKELDILNSLGEFKEVTNNSLNHNRILNNLRDNFNIIIPRK